MAIIYDCKARVFVLNKLYLFNQKGATLLTGSALLRNIKIGWIFLPQINTPAYYEHWYITAIKTFYGAWPRDQCCKKFWL